MQQTNYYKAELSRLITLALAEDVGEGDVTSQLLIPADKKASLVFRNREPLVVAAIDLIEQVYAQLDENISVEYFVEEGAHLSASSKMAVVKGNAQALLTGERVALNILQRACGVATLTNRFVQEISDTEAVILDTRKTMPSMRYLDKYAVRCGGGQNHRMRLDDRILIKDNHIAICGFIANALKSAKSGNKDNLLIEIECDTIAQLEEVLAEGADWVLLDNMDNAMLAKAVAMASNHSIELEASGGVNLDTVKAIAETGVNAISVGALTHSAIAVDIGLDFSYLD